MEKITAALAADLKGVDKVDGLFRRRLKITRSLSAFDGISLWIRRWIEGANPTHLARAGPEIESPAGRVPAGLSAWGADTADERRGDFRCVEQKPTRKPSGLQ